MFRRLFFRPSGVCEDKQTGHVLLGFVRQETVGTELDVPVPKKIISTTLAILFMSLERKK